MRPLPDGSLLGVALDSSRDLILVHDSNFRILRVNRSLAERLGSTPATLVGLPVAQALSRNGHNWKSCPYCEGAAGTADAPDSAFGVYLLASNSDFLDPAGSLPGTVHVLHDVTEHRLAVERYRALFENVQEGVFISTPDGRFVDFNDSFQRMVGYDDRNELMRVDIGKTLYVNVEDRGRLKRLLERDGHVREFEFQLRRRDGEVRTVIESSVASRDASGRVVAYQGFILDITERKRAEEELRQRNADLARLHQEARRAYDELRLAQEQLLQSGKMAAVGQLISGVAHELNNPLTAILGYSQLLADSPEVTPQGAEYLQKIYKQAQRTHRIIQNLLSFARQHKPERRPVDIHDAVEETIVLREYDLRLNNIRIHREYGNRIPSVHADPHQLQQVFLNILNNAVDAILENSREGDIWVRTRSEDGRVHLQVTDSGPGATDLSRVFDPFYTTKPVGRGTGLGLSICYGIIQEHGGTIHACNAAPHGACFTITLPAVEVEPQASVATQAPARAALQGARVLVVDDEESILDLESRILAGCGAQVQAARSGREAVSLLEGGAFDAVITDLKMPGDIGGLDLYRWIETHRPALATHVVFTMSHLHGEQIRRELEHIGRPAIQKPFPVEDFLSVIEAALKP